MPNIKFFQIKVFALLNEICKLFKVVQNARHWLLQYKCYIYVNPKKMLLLNMSNLDSAFQNEMVKFSVKIQESLDLTFLIWSMLLFFITCDNYDYN